MSHFLAVKRGLFPSKLAAAYLPETGLKMSRIKHFPAVRPN
jgi:hypothetical protein